MGISDAGLLEVEEKVQSLLRSILLGASPLPAHDEVEFKLYLGGKRTLHNDVSGITEDHSLNWGRQSGDLQAGGLQTGGVQDWASNLGPHCALIALGPTIWGPTG